MTFHPFFAHKKELVELWEKTWCALENHETATAEIHRKVRRMVTPMSECDAKLMLKEMRQAVVGFPLVRQASHQPALKDEEQNEETTNRHHKDLSTHEINPTND